MATKPSALAAATEGVDRHLRGDTNEIMGSVNGSVVINQGDLVILDAVAGSAQQSTATYKAYPASWVKGCTHAYFSTTFVGVAMNSSKSGVTEDIAIATTGIFRFPVSPAAGQTTLAGYIVSGATYGAGSAVSVFSQKVTAEVAASVDANDARIGMVIRGQTTSTTCDFMLTGSRFSGATKTIWPV
jgi:hypothetical protein